MVLRIWEGGRWLSYMIYVSSVMFVGFWVIIKFYKVLFLFGKVGGGGIYEEIRTDSIKIYNCFDSIEL
jgi:hypothetical protein